MIVLPEGSSFYISAAVAEHFQLQDQQELTFEESSLLANYGEAKRRALNYLARREHSRKQLEIKLIQKGYQAEVIALVLDELEAENALNERRFAEAFVASRQRSNPEGKSILIQRLRQKGVNRNLATEVVREWFSDPERRQDALLRAYNKLARTSKTEEELYLKLRKKGFPNSEIREAFDTH